MAPSLTTGSINKILNGEDVPNAVIQILNCKKLLFEGNVRYRLLISDGVTGYPFTMLATKLNQMVVNKELEKFTVVRVNRCVCIQVQVDRKAIILFSLTVLVPGNEINEKLGNPTNLNTASSTEKGINGIVHTSAKPVYHPDQNQPKESETEPETGTISVTEMINFLNLETYTMVPSLSTGSIKKVLNFEYVPNAVLQILGSKTITCHQGYSWYRFLISDGVTGYPIALLDTDLNHMVVNKELERFTVIRVDKWHCTNIADRKTIHLEDLKVLVPGNEINKMLGNPFNSKTVSSIATLSENGINGTVPASVSGRS